MSVKTIPLWRDVPAGGHVRLGAELATPAVPGAYTLELGLVQDARSPSQCGVATVDIPLSIATTAPARPRPMDQGTPS